MKSVAVLGIDLGKNSCSVAGLDEAGRVVLRRRLPRDGLAALLDKQPGCVVAMEACCGAHFVGRSAQARGHEVRLMREWLRDLLARAHKNTVIVALAAKLARIAWAVLARGGSYEAALVTS